MEQSRLSALRTHFARHSGLYIYGFSAAAGAVVGGVWIGPALGATHPLAGAIIGIPAGMGIGIALEKLCGPSVPQ